MNLHVRPGRTAIGALSVVLAALSPQAHALDIVFDYSHDTTGFFADATRRAVMEAAAAAYESRIVDHLTAFTSGPSGSVTIDPYNPPDPNGPNLKITNFSVAADEYRVFVGGSAYPMVGQLAVGGAGGIYSCSGGTAFCNNVRSRGQIGALATPKTDIGAWGGYIVFDGSENWYADVDTGTVESFSGQYDLYSLALHELGHVFGYGHTPSGTVSDVNGTPQVSAYTPGNFTNERKYLTTADYAALQSIGWQVSAVPEPQAGALMMAGLLALAWRRGRQMKARVSTWEKAPRPNPGCGP